MIYVKRDTELEKKLKNSFYTYRQKLQMMDATCINYIQSAEESSKRFSFHPQCVMKLQFGPMSSQNVHFHCINRQMCRTHPYYAMSEKNRKNFINEHLNLK